MTSAGPKLAEPKLAKTKLAMIAHDDKKAALVEWAKANAAVLQGLSIVSTGTTGGRLVDAVPDLDIARMKSGPLGGDQQIGAMIAEGEVGALVFFIDPLSPMPHDVDVKALTRLATVYDVPMALSPHAADMLILAGLDAVLAPPEDRAPGEPAPPLPPEDT